MTCRRIAALLLFCTVALQAQDAPFDVRLEQVDVPGFTGVQSFAFGQHDGKWLILGGRIDGLHRRQPFASFAAAGQNTDAIVLDPRAARVWTAPLSSLPPALSEPLSSTNMQFRQDGDMLYLVGGYGFSPTADDHLTFATLTAVDVPAVIRDVVRGALHPASFRQLSDTLFAVTGGRMEKIHDRFHLAGGHRFDGRYNPMGMSSFVQRYTDQIRSFRLVDDGVTLAVKDIAVLEDAINLHRRDYNLAPQILPDGREGLTMFSGVFQPDADIPFLHCVTIDSSGYRVDTAFSQYYNHYHCATMTAYSASAKEMHSVFFGGIAEYFDSAGVLTQDYNVPFVKTIARVTRDRGGTMAEYKLPAEMPDLLGAGAEFIPAPGVSRYPNGVLDLDSMATDTVLAGYVVGGIASSAANVFWINTGEESIASGRVFRVLLYNHPLSAPHALNAQSVGPLRLQVLPFPYHGFISVTFQLPAGTKARLRIEDARGRIVVDRQLRKRAVSGKRTLKCAIRNLRTGGVFIARLETANESVLQKIIVDP
ncbi:MAG: T9SS C-terminal target domain-containing protein [Ignavibacteria bacterium]|nr:T9SS C-terminal target domain-containing protein [Ignavibacteria bacterium]